LGEHAVVIDRDLGFRQGPTFRSPLTTWHTNIRSAIESGWATPTSGKPEKLPSKASRSAPRVASI